MAEVCEVVHTTEVATEKVLLHEIRVIPKLKGQMNTS
jgi:hypothetical protein